MFFIPGWLIAIVTFPGIVVHEAGHMLFCRLRKVAVLDVCYLRAADPPGYVVHERCADFTTSFLVAVGPAILNTVLCFVLCFPEFVRVRAFDLGDPVSYLLLWLGLSIGMHAFPSTQDAANLWAEAKIAVKEHSVLALVSFPIVVLIYVANVLRVVWFDLIYGAAIGLLLPELILKLVS
jgi:hypothetical protein